MDVVIPMVFPDYLIAVNTPDIKLDPLPWAKFDNLMIKGTKNKVPELGHAGVLFVNGKSGLTKYYEYGRYDAKALGLVRRLPVPDAVVSNGQIDRKSLAKVLKAVSKTAGQGGRIRGVYIEVDNTFQEMLGYAELRMKQNSNPKREPYGLLTNSCIHFAKDVVEAAGVSTPWLLNPRPNSYIGEFRDEFPDLDYDLKADTLTIEESTKP